MSSLAPREARERVLRALARGPLYEGAVPMMANLSEREGDRALRELQRAGRIERQPGAPYTWQVRDDTPTTEVR
jgi:hypothetical protein